MIFHVPARTAASGLRHLAGQREGEGERVVGHLVDAVVGNVANRDAALAGGDEIDAVDADAVADDHFAALERRDEFAADGGPLHEERIGVAAERDELGGRLALRDDELVAGGGEERALLVDGGKTVVGEDNFHESGGVLRDEDGLEVAVAGVGHAVEGGDGLREGHGFRPRSDIDAAAAHQLEGLGKFFDLRGISAEDLFLGERDAVGIEFDGVAGGGRSTRPRRRAGARRARGVWWRPSRQRRRRRSTPSPSVHASAAAATSSSLDATVRAAPSLRATSSRPAERSQTMVLTPRMAWSACWHMRPMGPAPITRAGAHGEVPREVDDVHAVAERLGERGGLRGESFGPRDRRSGRDVDELGEGAAAVQSEDLAVLAEMGVTTGATHATAARDERVANKFLANERGIAVAADGGDNAAELVAHDERRRTAWAVVFEGFQFAAAKGRRRGDAEQDLVGGGLRRGHVANLEAGRRRDSRGLAWARVRRGRRGRPQGGSFMALRAAAGSAAVSAARMRTWENRGRGRRRNA